MIHIFESRTEQEQAEYWDDRYCDWDDLTAEELDTIWLQVPHKLAINDKPFASWLEDSDMDALTVLTQDEGLHKAAELLAALHVLAFIA